METENDKRVGTGLPLLVLSALGVVFGDIGTSPLYAFRVCFSGDPGLPVTPANVLGILSLIFWALVLVITFKYMIFVMRADNRGEGGILALTALLMPGRRQRLSGSMWTLWLAGLVTASFLVFDLGFFTSNLAKIPSGGWFPLLIAGIVFVGMTTWHRGRQILARRLREELLPVEEFLKDVVANPPLRVPGTAVFMSGTTLSPTPCSTTSSTTTCCTSVWSC